ncbi:MAG TPA: serine hydrolase domain-containing protein [Planctomycetota bacterium]|nr:serine hydrolase domain-containing protein [Planctomycetota bacterium]
MLSALLLVTLQVASPTDAPADARARAAAAVEAWLAAGRAPGVSAALAFPDGDTWAVCAGVTDPAGGRALAPDDRLLAGSVGKTFVAATALALVAEGRLDIDAPVGERLGREPWFERLPNAEGLTLRHLLTHRSGLPRYVFAPAFTRDLAADPERTFAPAELLAYVFDAEPRFAPGAGFAYSDTNYLVAGLCIEHAAGATLYAEVERRFLAPLELAGTIPSDRRVLPGLVQGHTGRPDPLGLPPRVLDAEGRFAINPQFEWAGGGFASTPRDLARWARALYGGRALDLERTSILLDAQPAPELGRDVGYGMAAIAWPGPGGAHVGHSGFFPGYLTEVRYWPEHDVAIAVQVNTSDARRLGRPISALAGALLELALER